MDKSKVLNLADERKRRKVSGSCEKAHNLFLAMNEGTAELKQQAYELSHCASPEPVCPSHQFGLLIGDIRRVQERLRSLKKYFTI